MTNIEPDLDDPPSFADLVSPDRESGNSYDDAMHDSDGSEHSTTDAESTRSETSTTLYDRMFTPSAAMIAQHRSELLRRGDGLHEEDDLRAHLRALEALLVHESVHVTPDLADYAALAHETPMGSMASDHPKCIAHRESQFYLQRAPTAQLNWLQHTVLYFDRYLRFRDLCSTSPDAMVDVLHLRWLAAMVQTGFEEMPEQMEPDMLAILGETLALRNIKRRHRLRSHVRHAPPTQSTQTVAAPALVNLPNQVTSTTTVAQPPVPSAAAPTTQPPSMIVTSTPSR
jgi:hypothetical protein